MTKQEQIKAIIYKHTYHGGTHGVPLTIDVESIAIEIDKELAEIRGKTCDSCKYGTGYYRCVTCDHYEKWEPIK